MNEVTRLPEVSPGAWHPIEQLLAHRRSVRDFANKEISLEELARLLWAAQGVTDPAGLRCAPSAGALFPLELTVVAGKVQGLQTGIYRYRPLAHALGRVAAGDARRQLASAALGQSWVGDAAAAIVLAAVFDRTTRKYGRRGIQYVCIEVGHAAQNVYLEAQALGLGTVIVGAFDDEEIRRVVYLGAEEMPLALMPLGRR